MKQLTLAHRGYHKKCVENSHGAFQQAYENLFDGVELDLRISVDHELIVFHDASTERLANENILINQQTSDQLSQVSIFKKRLFVSKGNEKILTFKQFLNNFYDKFKCINLELKFEYIDENILINKLLGELKQYDNFYEKIIISSFNLNVLVKLHQIDPKVKLGYLFDHLETLQANLNLVQTNCQFLCANVQTFLKNKDFFRKIGIPLIVWTIKRKKQYRHCLTSELVFGQIMDKKISV